jgi:cold shock CspA family protein
MGKLKGVLTRWNDIAGYGFVATRDEFGTRMSYFLHHSRISHIEGGGVPKLGSEVLFNLEPNAKGPMCVDAEVGNYEMRRIARTLANGSTEGVK